MGGSDVISNASKYGMYLGGTGSIFSITPYLRYCEPGTTEEEVGKDKATCVKLRPHYGRDLTRPADGTRGAPILAALGGTVTTSIGKSSGKNITIDHQDGSRTVYMHLNDFVKATGQWADAGELIGYAGSTGRSSGPHLHFEYFPPGVAHNNGNQKEPVAWLSSTQGAIFPIGVAPNRTSK